MQKSPLSLYMQKVAEGDNSFAGRLCGQLADRLLYVPTKAQAKTGQAVKVSIVRLFEDGKHIVPVFTAEKKLREWAQHSGRTVDSISLLGADFCSALDGVTSIWVDPGSEPNVKLPPEFVREISMSGGSGDYGEIASAATAPTTSKEPIDPPREVPVASSLASFPRATPPVEPPVPPQPQPAQRVARKEEFPPFVPPSAQPGETGRVAPRGVEQREPPPLETMRAHRSSLAAGVLMGEPGDTSEVNPAGPAAVPEQQSSAPTESQPVEKKKKGLFGLFSKK